MPVTVLSDMHGIPTKRNASERVLITHAKLVIIPTINATLTIITAIPADAMKTFTGTLKSTNACWTATRIRAKTWNTVTDSVMKTETADPTADALKDTHGFHISVLRISATLIRAKILKIPTVRAPSYTLPTNADALKVTDGHTSPKNVLKNKFWETKRGDS